MRDSRTIGLVIPALNEAANLGDVLSRIPGWVDFVCVVDNGSSDGTSDVARGAGATTLLEARRGYGWACSAGIGVARHVDVIVFADADGSDDLSAIDQLVNPILGDSADLVLGNRMAGFAEKHSLSVAQRAGNALACHLIRWRFGHRYSDLGPFRAVRTASLLDLGLRQMTYGWTVEMQVRALTRGIRVAEIPVCYRTRRAGRSKVSGSPMGIIRAGYHIIRTILLEPRH